MDCSVMDTLTHDVPSPSPRPGRRTLLYTAKQAGRNAVGFRDDSGFVGLAGAAAARRSIPRLAHERTVRRPAVG